MASGTHSAGQQSRLPETAPETTPAQTAEPAQIANSPAIDRAAAIEISDTAFDIVALAASAGGISALIKVVSALPAAFPTAIVIVQHLHRKHRSMLPEILKQHTALAVKPVESGDRLHPATLYVAPPDRHVVVTQDGILRLTDSELINFVRPSADCLFETMAHSFQQRAIAVVLTGTGRDGAAGILAIKRQGGVTIAQDQSSSEYFGMPDAAIHTQAVDYVLPLNAIAAQLVELVLGKGRGDRGRKKG